jgi:hypothetical protein
MPVLGLRGFGVLQEGCTQCPAAVPAAQLPVTGAYYPCHFLLPPLLLCAP